MKGRRLHRVSVFILIGILLTGCSVWPFMAEEDGYRPIEMGKRDQVWYWDAPRPVVLSQDFGNSFRMAKKSQILNIDPVYGNEPVTGFDGKAAVNTILRYRKFFEAPAFKQKASGASRK